MPNYFWPTILLLLAVALMFLEIFIPSGGLLSVLAGIAFAACVVVAFATGGAAVGSVFLVIVGIVIPTLLFLLIKWWPRTAIGRRILIQPPGEEELIPLEVQSLRELIGQRGTALTPMLPSGAIRLGRQTMDAVSDGRSIDKGTAIQVVAAKGNHLVVRPVPADAPPAADPVSPTMESIVPDPFDDSSS